MHGRVLVVDDDSFIREVLSEILREHGYDVDEAPDGAVALEAMRQSPPCLVLLDLMMPRVNGWEVCRRMGTEPALASVPVCVISASPDKPPPSAVCTFGKPIDLDRLLETVEAHCGITARRAAGR